MPRSGNNADTFELDSRYSTTRRVSKQAPHLRKNPKSNICTRLLLPPHQGRKGEGGLRLQGYYKFTDTKYPLISVITVVFNAEKYLERTIQSVVNQNYKNVEFIILDGGSSDSTLDIVKKYDNQIDYWVSEPDGGIYDAMNKALSLAAGDWFIHINAGDELIPNALALTSEKLDTKYGFVYGNAFVSTVERQGYVFGRAFKQSEEILSNSCLYHQAVFYNQSHANYYDTSYQYVADRIMTFEILRSNINIPSRYVDILVSTFLDGGFSSRDCKNIIKEEFSYLKENNLLTPGLYFKYFLKYIKAKVMDILIRTSLYGSVRRIWRYLTFRNIKQL